jgi:ribosomal protein L37AE/L43A
MAILSHKRQLEYKIKMANQELVCGKRDNTLQLSKRVWTCSFCGTEMINACGRSQDSLKQEDVGGF